MNFRYKKSISVAVMALALTMTSCESDLNRDPITDVTSVSVYSNFNNYQNVLAKLYSGLALGGQNGGDGNPDISGIDGGFSNYMRQLFTLQEITTDEAVIGWGDGNLPDMHKMTWSASNEFIGALYSRIFFQVSQNNDFIRETTDEKLAQRGITGDNLTQAKYMRAEARFLRALSYYHALDLFGNVPFVTEKDAVGTLPKQISRAELFTYIESELKDVEGQLKDARTNVYGRADKATAWALLARLYLNSKVYTGTERNADVIAYCNKIISAGYSLKPKYQDLFLADNDVANPETIFSVNYDGVHSQSWGGTTFLVHASVGGSMNASEYGVNGGWWGLRVTKDFVNKFNSGDKRGNFYTAGQNLEINDLGNFTDGYAFTKYKNVTSAGVVGKDGSGNFVDADMPIFRLADVYLMYAEATLRGGGGSTSTAVDYINKLRERAYGNTSGNITAADLNLNFILDERSRELSWELTRRTDLIRYGLFTSGNYVWAWKGNVKNGQAVGDFRNLYPIPTSDISANPNLKQNPGY